MPRSKIFQAYNNKIDAWVKFKKVGNKPPKILNVKQANPTKKFKGVRVAR